MYRLEIHTATVMGHMIRIQASQCAVRNPSLVDSDEELSGSLAGKAADDDEWLTGWNLITDLYMILEHAIYTFRLKRTSVQLRKHQDDIVMSATSVLEKIETFQAEVPSRFHQASRCSTNLRMNRCGFQAANMIVTLQVRRHGLC